LIEFAYAVRRCALARLRVETHGVKVLGHDAAGRVLLVRHRYGAQQWMLPGSGVQRGKAPIDAALRELREERGLRAAVPSLFARYQSTAEGRRDTIDLFFAHVTGEPIADGVELATARFFAPGDLPVELSPATKRRLAEWRGERAVDACG
jgi:8-oxo-dGTP pyrophosphatase MutT (NUDIX family)